MTLPASPLRKSDISLAASWASWEPASSRLAAAPLRAFTRRIVLPRSYPGGNGRPAIYNLVSQELNDPDGWKEHLQWLEDSFKEGIRAYGSCISITAGPIFNLRLGLDVPQDEDLISPHIMFAGMPTWDSVMARPTPERIRAFRDTEIRRALSAEAVEGTVAQVAPGTDRRGSPRGFFNRRWDLVEVFMAHQERNRQFEGKSVEQLAQEQGKGIMEAFLDLSLDENLETHFLCVDRNVDVDSQRQILGSPYTVIGTTDGGARPGHDGPLRIQHQSAGLLGTGKAGHVTGRCRLSADGQDRPDARTP